MLNNNSYLSRLPSGCMAVVSISMPDSLLEAVDSFADEHGYTGRSEIVRSGLRTVLSEATESATGDPQLATLVVCFDYGDARVERKISHVRHEAGELVIAHAHGHAEDCCLELLAVYGSPAARQSLAAELRAIGGVSAVSESVSGLTKTGIAEAAD